MKDFFRPSTNYVADEERTLSTIRAIFKSPVNFLDTSRIYGHGRSEQRIGRVIQELGGLPDDLSFPPKLIEIGKPILRILRGVKSHGEIYLKGTAPKTNPKIPNSRRANP